MLLTSPPPSPSSPAAPTFRYTPTAPGGSAAPQQASTCFLLRLDCLAYCLASGRTLDGAGLSAPALTLALVRQLEEFRSCMIAHGGKPVGAFGDCEGEGKSVALTGFRHVDLL